MFLRRPARGLNGRNQWFMFLAQPSQELSEGWPKAPLRALLNAPLETPYRDRSRRSGVCGLVACLAPRLLDKAGHLSGVCDQVWRVRFDYCKLFGLLMKPIGETNVSN